MPNAFRCASLIFCQILIGTTLILNGPVADAKSLVTQLPDDPTSEIIQPFEGSSTFSGSSFSKMMEALPINPSILRKYEHLDPKKLVDTGLLKQALTYFDSNVALFGNRSFVTVIDFAKRSTEKRMFIIDMKSGEVLALHTAHGKGSDPQGKGYATQFSNQEGSNASSLGFYRAAETYDGKNGLSLRLDGLSITNSNARSRAVVLHGANYVQESPVIQGRSWGCPAVSKAYLNQVVSLLKNGSLIFAGFGQP